MEFSVDTALSDILLLTQELKGQKNNLKNPRLSNWQIGLSFFARTLYVRISSVFKLICTHNKFSIFPTLLFLRNELSQYWFECKLNQQYYLRNVSSKTSIYLVARCLYSCVNCCQKYLHLLFSICVKASVKNVLWESKMKVSKFFKSTNMLFSICWQHINNSTSFRKSFLLFGSIIYVEKRLSNFRDEETKHFYFWDREVFLLFYIFLSPWM